MSREKNRHWYILRKLGSEKIYCLLSAFSEDHIKRKLGLEGKEGRGMFIEKAKRWHIVRVFSGAPVFQEYKTDPRRNDFSYEDVERYVVNEFHTIMDGEKILVKVLS